MFFQNIQLGINEKTTLHNITLHNVFLYFIFWRQNK